jgi:transposase
MKAGRKTKLTPELIGQIETSLQSHVSIITTCDLVGISQETFFRWLREGEAATSGSKREFYETVKRARAMSRVMLVSQISKDPSWQAKAWILERQYPEEFGRRQLIAHAGADGKSDLPTAAAPAVKLTINMQKADGDAPWIFKTEQDEDPATGGDAWPTDHHGFDSDPPPGTGPTPEPTGAKPGAPPNHAPTRGPAIPPRNPAADTGGRPRDPDDQP